MKSIKGTQTERNLLMTFAGEAQARMRYTYYSQVAQKEGYDQIAAIFLETAEMERMHAKQMFKRLEGGMVEVTGSYPAGVIASTLSNLKEAAAGEHEEWSDLYPNCAIVAENEGFLDIALMYNNICVAEKGHEERYLRLLANMEMGDVFSRESETVWMCRKCGYLHVGKEAPESCPACHHPQGYFEIKAENY